MILVICSGSHSQQRITQCLTEHCFLHDRVSNFQSATSLLATQHYSLIIAEAKGTDDCRGNIATLVSQHPDCWIMVVSATDNGSDGVDYYEVGADDFLPGEFSERLFIARIRAHMRRAIPIVDCDERIDIGPLTIDSRYHSVLLNGQSLALTAREFTLLNYLCRHPNQVFSRNQLLSAVWGYNHEGYEHTVNTHVNRLRSKLDEVEGLENASQLVQTVWGVGYKLNVAGLVAKALSA